VNPTAKAFRVSKLHATHGVVLSALTGAGQGLSAIAAACGITQDQAESRLSIVVDEGLATRTRGSRTSATYALN